MFIIKHAGIEWEYWSEEDFFGCGWTGRYGEKGCSYYSTFTTSLEDTKERALTECVRLIRLH